ncbi:hypothetical protein [Streptomyces flavidovirens]|uniref:hypothetical protein n=1 Tax=Streptomyces flavidovirens TaxID=67298 RepID=UPI0036A427F9
MKSRDMSSLGYHQALAEHPAVAAERQVDSAIAAAVERQNRALRQQRERVFADDQAALEQLLKRARLAAGLRRWLCGKAPVSSCAVKSATCRDRVFSTVHSVTFGICRTGWDVRIDGVAR